MVWVLHGYDPSVLTTLWGEHDATEAKSSASPQDKAPDQEDCRQEGLTSPFGGDQKCWKAPPQQPAPLAQAGQVKDAAPDQEAVRIGKIMALAEGGDAKAALNAMPIIAQCFILAHPDHPQPEGRGPKLPAHCEDTADRSEKIIQGLRRMADGPNPEPQRAYAMWLLSLEAVKVDGWMGLPNAAQRRELAKAYLSKAASGGDQMAKVLLDRM